MGIDSLIDFGWLLKSLHLKVFIQEIERGST